MAVGSFTVLRTWFYLSAAEHFAVNPERPQLPQLVIGVISSEKLVNV